jgi:glycosyltransferase involved in cell wall biosynthesis
LWREQGLSKKKGMRILHVSTQDKAGGAEKNAHDLHRSFLLRGHDSSLAVGRKLTDDQNLLVIDNNGYRNYWARTWRRAQESIRDHPHLARIAGWAANLGEGERWLEWQQGIEDFHFPGTRHLLSLPAKSPDLLHAHNLHGGYFDLRELPAISRQIPVVLTLHDEWAFTGHCAYTFECRRWESGCGACPSLDTYPAVKRDNTHYNWKRKRDIYSRSNLYISAASHWLLDKAQRSILQPVESKVIPYGIDLSLFHPVDKTSVRNELRLPQDAYVVLFIANKTRSNPFKDYLTIEKALYRISEKYKKQEIIFLCVGEESEDRKIGSATIRYLPYQTDYKKVAQFYQASDLYLHAAKAEAFGIVCAEAQACGVPVIATAVGGIPEVIENGVTGFLVPQFDSEAMADKTIQLLYDKEQLQKMGEAAIEFARRRFDLNRQVEMYLAWYAAILVKHKKMTLPTQ